MDLNTISLLTFFHIFISIATFGILGVAAVQAALLYTQNHLLRRKIFPEIIHLLPPIETMERRLFQIIWCGFILLTISLMSTWLFVDDFYKSSKPHKILLSWLAWCFFAALLFGHHYSGWRGPTAVRWTLTGVLVLTVAYFSSRLIF